jgi:O-antigen ligase
MPDFATNTIDAASDVECRRLVRVGVPGVFDNAVRYLCSIEPWFWLVAAYGFLIPVVALNLPGVGGLGAADLLMPIGAMTLMFGKRTGKIHLSHIAIALFSLIALISLLQIDQFKPAVDCAIRWIRLFGILFPFFFALFIKPTDTVVKTAFFSWMIGGLTAILIGIFLHVLQIEVRAGQQRLWMNGASILRAGGLIGNSGAFGHMTSTWAVICVTYFAAVSKSRFRILYVFAVVFFTFYVIYISSSRAAMLHLLSASAVFVVLFRVPRRFIQWLGLIGVYGVLGLALMVCVAQCLPASQSGGRSNALETNLKRFLPGYGGGSASEFTSNRADNWPEYIAMMNEKILTGWGYKMGVRLHEESPDNSYLSVLLETGVLGFVCMSMFVVGVFYRLINRYFAGDPFACVLIPVCVGQLANCLTSDIYTFWITMPVVFMLLGFVTQRTGDEKPGRQQWANAAT